MQTRCDRPRLLLGPERLARVKARASAGDPAFRALRAHCDGYLTSRTISSAHAIDFCLMWLCTGEPKYADKAIELALRIAAQGMAGAETKRGYNLRDYLPPACIVYDWCHDRMTRAQEETIRKQLIEWSAWAWSDRNGWGQKNPGSNFYQGFMFTWLVGLALPNAGVFAEQTRTKFLEEVRPYLETAGKGGYWLEGTSYGRSSSRFMSLYLLAHLTATGEDLLTTTPFIAENIRCRVHLTTPDGKRMVPFGAQSSQREAPITDYDRTPMRIAAAYLPTDLARLATDWLHWVEDRPVAKELLWEQLLWEEYDAATVRPHPRSYRAEGSGLVTARTSWEPEATMLAALCGPYREGHQDQAAGTFCLWAGGEWLIGPKRLWAGNGLDQTSFHHNVILVDGKGQSQLNTDSGIYESEDSENHARIRMAAGRAYDQPRHPLPDRLLQDWWRELLWIKPGFLLVSDRISKMDPDQDVTWQVHVPYKPDPGLGAGGWQVKGPNATLIIHFLGGMDFKIEVEHVPDSQGVGCWKLKRTAPPGRLTDEFHTLFQIKS